MTELCGKPLIFGDKEQIKEIKNMEEEQEQKESGIKRYNVTYCIEGEINIEVKSENKDGAKELAKQELEDMSSQDKLDCCEIEYESIKEIE